LFSLEKNCKWRIISPMTPVLLEPSPEEATDGRRARSHTSRGRIVCAVIKLIEAGNLSPSAPKVAETAGVGLRSVFRHFDDMESLYREVRDRVYAEVLPLIRSEVPGKTWKERLENLVAPRSTIFERVLPYRLSAFAKRHRSQFLSDEYAKFVRRDNRSVEAILPEHALANRPTTLSLQAILSFHNWHVLRHEQALSVEEARQVIMHTLRTILANYLD
jgi:AcrR family transcriptional regulator